MKIKLLIPLLLSLAIPSQAAQQTVTVGTSGSKASLDTNFNHIQANFVELYARPNYINLTSFAGQTPWRLFYSNTSGVVTELALGADGTYLKSNGASAAPTFATPTGSGDVLAPSSIGAPGNIVIFGADKNHLADGGTPLTLTATTPIDLTTGVISLQHKLYNGTSTGTPTSTGNINIDGLSYSVYAFNNGSSTATYTPVITSPPTSGIVRYITLIVGGGSGVDTLTWTNVTFMGTSGSSTTTTNKQSRYACEIRHTGNALCSIVAEAY
jgi:hypothetical protein